MSWTFSAVGRPTKVREKARLDLSQPTKHDALEQSIKEKVLYIIDVALLNFPADSAVEVSAGGSQSATPQKGVATSLSLSIKPIYGFME